MNCECCAEVKTWISRDSYIMAFKNIVYLFKLESLILYRATKIFYTKDRSLLYMKCFILKTVLYLISNCLLKV